MNRPSTADDLRARLLRDALVSIAIALSLLVALTWAVGTTFELSAFYPHKVLGIFVIGIVFLLAYLPAHLPIARFGPANQVTLARAILIALLAGLLGEDNEWRALLAATVGLVGLALDGVDGRLARQTGMATPFGARFDMETDSVLIVVLAALVWQLDKAGAWVLASGLARYAFVAAGWALPYMRRSLPPSMRRKTICVIQILALCAVLVPMIHPPWSALLAAAALTALCYSFAVDTIWLYRHRTTPSE